MSRFGILQLSDLHIADTLYWDLPVSRLQNMDYCLDLRRHIKKETIGLSKLYLVITGDITQTGDPGEFEMACNTINNMCERIGIEKSRVLLVPGNHDINWPGFVERLRKKGCCDRDNFYKEKAIKYNEFKAFYNQFYEKKRVFSADKSIFDMVEIEDSKILLLAINTLVHETQLQQDHHGFIDLKVLDDELFEIDKRYKSYKKIAVMHHNPKSSGGGMSDVQNWKQVEGLMDEYNIKTFMCGHTHQSESFALRRNNEKNFFVAGSIGKSDKNLNNSFLLLTIDEDKGKASSHFYHYVIEENLENHWEPDINNPNTMKDILL